MRATCLLGAILTAALLAGCGGGHSDKKANEAYATNVCTAISGWETQVTNIATDFSGGISKTTLDAKASQIEAATKDLVTQVKTVPAPDTKDGQAAKQQIESLTTEVTNTTAAVKTAVNTLGANPSGANVAAAIITLAPQVKSLASTAKSTIGAIRDAGGGIASAFKSTSECKNLSPTS